VLLAVEDVVAAFAQRLDVIGNLHEFGGFCHIEAIKRLTGVADGDSRCTTSPSESRVRIHSVCDEDPHAETKNAEAATVRAKTIHFTP
jgi:hypothetical protein